MSGTEYFLVECTCVDDFGKPYLVRENCRLCADARVRQHTTLGHRPVLRAPFPDIPDKATDKLMGGRRG